jgi:3-oxoadipate enol-lactonase
VLHVDERGSGVAVVLLHGAPTAPEHLMPLAARLARSWRVLVVHLPGYGRSAALEPYALEHSHALVEETLVARGVRETHLVGFSGGAYRAFALACRRETALRVRSVVSLAGVANFTEDEKAGLVRYVHLLSGVERPFDPAPMLVDLMLSPRGREHPLWVEDVRSWATSITPEHLARELEAFIGAPDLRPQIAMLDLPVLVRVGSIDAASPPERSRRIIEVARHGAFEEVPGVGHALLCEDFDSTAASIERHLRSH